MPYSKSFGRTAIVDVLKSEGQGLSLVSRHWQRVGPIQSRGSGRQGKDHWRVLQPPLTPSVHTPSLTLSQVGKKLRIGAWVKTGRTANKDEFAFLELNDGTTPTTLQALVPAAVWPIEELRHTGTCVLVEGELRKSPADATGQVLPAGISHHAQGTISCRDCIAGPRLRRSCTILYAGKWFFAY